MGKFDDPAADMQRRVIRRGHFEAGPDVTAVAVAKTRRLAARLQRTG